MTGRAKIGFGDVLGELGAFSPPASPRRAPVSSAAAAAEAGFISREPQSSAKVQRRHRTGRSAQINIKAKPETIADFTAWADRNGVSIAEAFEIATASLKKHTR